MQLKKIVTLITFILISHNSIAANNFHGSGILNHSEEKNVLLPENLKNLQNINDFQAKTSAYANPASGNHGGNIYASGNVGYQLYNTSSSRQYYYIDIYMCIENQNCIHTRDTVYVDPNLNYSGGGSVFTSAWISTAGRYEDEAIIVVSGAENSSAKGVNVVQVY